MKLKDHQIKEQLRELSNNIKKSDEVLLPDCSPKDFYKADVECEFVPCKLSRLLYFIADMI